MDFDCCGEYLRRISNSYYGSVKKNTFSFSCDLQIDKKINNPKKKKNPRIKTDSN